MNKDKFIEYLYELVRLTHKGEINGDVNAEHRREGYETVLYAVQSGVFDSKISS